MAASAKTLEVQESYAETTQYKILDWYMDIGRSLAKAGALMDYAFGSSRMVPEVLDQLYAELTIAKNSLIWFPSTLFTKDDIENVAPYDKCLENAKARKGRKPVAQDIDEQKKNYLQFRLDLQDEYVALASQMVSVREIMAANNWFELTKRPKPRPHSTDLKYKQ